MSDFASRLRDARKAKGMTQQQLADAVGMSRSTIAGYESSGKEPDYGVLVKLCEALSISSDYLTGAPIELPNRFAELAASIYSLRDSYEVAPPQMRALVDELIDELHNFVAAALAKDNADALKSGIDILRTLRNMV